MPNDPVARFYGQYWRDPDHAAPVGDPDAKHRLQIVRQALGKTAAQRILDVGCGRGDFASQVAADGHAVHGMELVPAAVDAAQRLHPDLPITCHGVEDEPWPFSSASFDVVMAMEVIEHLLHPGPLFGEAVRILRPGGRLFVSTPFHGVVKNVILSAVAFDHHFCNLESGHIRFYTDRHIAQLAQQHGLRVERIYHYGRSWPIWRGLLLVARRDER